MPTACPPANEKSSPFQWFCVSGPPLPFLLHSFVDHIYTHCVCCIDPPRHQLGAFNACVRECVFWAEKTLCDTFTGPSLLEGHFWITRSLTLRMCLLRCECNSVIRLFLLLKCSKNTSVHVENNYVSASFLIKLQISFGNLWLGRLKLKLVRIAHDLCWCYMLLMFSCLQT